MRKWNILLFVPIILSRYGFSQDIKVPDEKVIGEDYSIKKSVIFISPAPDFEVLFPEITISEEKLQGKIPSSAEIQQKKPTEEGYFCISAGSYEFIQSSFFYNRTAEKNTNYSILFENSFTGGHRTNGEEQKTGLIFHSEEPSSYAFSMDFKRVDLGLPGKDTNPFNINRDSISIKNSFSYLKEGFIPSLNQSFYRIDDASTNFLLINLFIDNSPFIFETEVEREDVFQETSTMSLSQSILMEKGDLTIGSGLKIIEGYGLRILPILHYTINKNLSFGLKSSYKIPNLFEDVMTTNYKEFIKYNLAPEEEYKFTISFNKERENMRFGIDITQDYRDKFYTWVDTDKNSLLEPYPEQCWQTSIGLNLKQQLSDNLNIFLTGEKKFHDREINFYPEEILDAGIILSSSGVTFKTWVSYNGERVFPEKEMGSDTILNTELKMLYDKKAEWGIGVYNITDREYFLLPGYPAEGRRIVSYLKMFF